MLAPSRLQLGHVHEAIFEDRLADDARAVGHRREHHDLRLHVGRKSRVRTRDHVDGAEALGPDHAQASGLDATLDAGLDELVDHRVHVLDGRVFEQHVPTRDRGRHGEGAGFDAIGEDRMIDPRQFIDAVDLDLDRAGPGHARAHLVEEQRELFDLGLARDVLQASYDPWPARPPSSRSACRRR